VDRRTILAVVLSLAIYYGWVSYRTATAPPPDPAAIAAVEGAPAPAPVDPAPAPTPSPLPVEGPPVRELPFTACGTRGTLSTAGGALSDVVLDAHRAPYVVTPLYQWAFDWMRGKGGAWKPYGDDPGPAVLVSDAGEVFVAGAGDPAAEPVRFVVVEDEPGHTRLVGITADRIAIERTTKEVRTGDACTVESTVTWRNTTTAPYTGGTWISMHDVVPASHSRYAALRQPVAVVDGALTYGGPTGAGCVREGTALGPDTPRIPVPGPVDFVGLSDRYFGMYALPMPATTEVPPEATFTRKTRDEDVFLDGTVLADPAPLAPGDLRIETYRLYAGANQVALLSAADPRLTQAIDLGWSAFFAWPLLWLLRLFHTGVGNWGVAIILLTVLVKAAFFPLTQASFRSMRRMQEIQPLLQEVRKTYADNPEEMNRRTMALMSEHKVNPLSGCLPQLVQIPVWLALYNALLSSVELYQTRFLYLKDLSEPDPYLVLPVAITALMWAQQQLSTPTNMDPTQQQIMRWMPLIFGFLFFAFPSGLAVYVFVNVLLSIGQQWLINRSAGPASPGVAPKPDQTAAVG
jgi:YidC/Oxa1 family membrane protein insertase